MTLQDSNKKLLLGLALLHKNLRTYKIGEWVLGKWIIVICGFFISQILFFYILLNSSPLTPRNPTSIQHPLFIPGISISTNPILQEFLRTFDPRIYAGVHQNGISGFIWNDKQQSFYTPSMPRQPFYTINAPNKLLGQELSEFMLPVAESIKVQADPYIPTMKLKEPVSRTHRTQSELRLSEKTLSSWKIPQLNIPTQSWDKELKNTIIKAWLGKDGLIFSATLISSCGLPSADNDAIKAVSGLRLLPKNQESKSISANADNWLDAEPIFLTVIWATHAP